jgi:hypothetical protein
VNLKAIARVVLIVVMLNRLTRLLSSFFLNGVWLVRDERVRIGLYFMLGRTGFILVVDARSLFLFAVKVVILSRVR